MKIFNYLVLIFGFILIAACSNDADNDLNNESLTSEQVKSQMQVNSISDGLDEMVSELLINDKAGKSNKSNTDSACAAITFTEESMSVAYNQCIIRGKTVSGTIVLTGNNGNTEGNTGSFEVTFTDFTFNGHLLNGTKTFSFDFSDSNSPTFTVVTDATFEDANGDIIDWKGNKVLSWHLDQINAEGADVTCTGDWDITVNGIKYEFTVAEPLGANLGCAFITTGLMQLEVGDMTASLDFGTGSCDQKGTVTYPNGETEEVSW
ncbi:hypothetical protein [Arenibacter sp. F20364]|uniref:hypothetical protein n=1 Tax=Arenibacter sp. F20364 TaxID=2926415 RepID=UPI001FF4BA59|nr:hypothetical protein [Arenibacter sp. F20364]MCK0191077.1 hypothetical protein [Arenibacter sp. F20364]